jgi:hypothetical protein
MRANISLPCQTGAVNKSHLHFWIGTKEIKMRIASNINGHIPCHSGYSLSALSALCWMGCFLQNAMQYAN